MNVMLNHVQSTPSTEFASGARSRLSLYDAALHSVLTGAHPVPNLLAQTAEVTAEHLGQAHVRIWTFNVHRDLLELQARAGFFTECCEAQARIPMGKGAIGTLAQERRLYVTNSIEEGVTAAELHWLQERGIEAFAHLPLVIDDRLLGVIVVFSGRAFTDSDLEILLLGAERIGLGIDRRLTMSALSEALQEAQQVVQIKSDFVAQVSHEIRTPLNGVIATTELLLKTQLAPMQQDLARTTLASADTLLTMVNSILDLSKMDAGKLSLSPAPFDLQWASEKVADMLFARAHEKALEVIVRHAPGTPRFVIGDSERIQQVLRNLVSNAIKFSHHGTVVVNIECETQSAADAVFRFEVTDTGIGIAKRDLKRIFESFTQVDSSTTRQQGGTGLGLAISRDLVQLMGGIIGVNSERGIGSTFWFTLKLQLDTQPPTVSTAPPFALRGLHTLLVVGNEISRHVISEWLSEGGIRSVVCTASKDLLPTLREAAANRLPFDIVLLDNDMPGIPISVLGRAIKSDPELSHTSLVMLTSGVQAWDSTPRRRQHDPPSEAIFTPLMKPVRRSQLFEALLSALSARSAAQHQHPDESSPPPDHLNLGAVVRGPSDDEKAKHRRILVVEDNAVNQKVARLILEPLGFRVDMAENGKVAIKMTKNDAYALIFMDCQMPEMDGYEATQQIRRREGPNQRTPIVAMTANSAPSDRKQCLSVGMDELLPKPIRQSQLFPILERYIAIVPEVDDVVDRAALLNLIAGDLEFLPGFVDLFLAEFSRLQTEVCLTIGNGNYEALGRSAHELKGINLGIRAYGVVSAVEALESMAEKQDPPGAKEAFAALEGELNRVVNALKALVNEHSQLATC